MSRGYIEYEPKEKKNLLLANAYQAKLPLECWRANALFGGLSALELVSASDETAKPMACSCPKRSSPR